MLCWVFGGQTAKMSWIWDSGFLDWSDRYPWKEKERFVWEDILRKWMCLRKDSSCMESDWLFLQQHAWSRPDRAWIQTPFSIEWKRSWVQLRHPFVYNGYDLKHQDSLLRVIRNWRVKGSRPKSQSRNKSSDLVKIYDNAKSGWKLSCWFSLPAILCSISRRLR